MLEERKYKNWPELCEAMGWNTTGGTYKQARLKELDRLCKYHKEGRTFIIDEIYDIPLEKLGSRKEYKGLNIVRDEYEHNGIYRITLGNKIYIGSTIAGFRKSFLVHYHGGNKGLKHTYELIQDGGIFEILEDMTGSDEEIIRKREIDYIKKYSTDDKWEVINRKKYITEYNAKNKKDLFDGVYKDEVIQKMFDILVKKEKKTNQ